MAMAKPIIATNVFGIPQTLDGCGWIIEPENLKQLVETMQYVYEHLIETNARQTDVKGYV